MSPYDIIKKAKGLIMNNLSELLRAYSLPMSITPFLIAFACAVKTPVFSFDNFLVNSILVLIGVSTAHLAANLFDDYIDVKLALKKGFNLHAINFKNAGKAKLILNETYSIKSVEIILVILSLIAALIGVYFVFLRGPIIAFYMFLTFILCIFYPISSKYGLSELITGVIFGPVMINAVYFALCGRYDMQVFYFSAASGLATIVLLICHSLMDYELDVENGKKTIPVLLENKNLAINVISMLILLSYGFLTATGCYFDYGLLTFLPVILTLPIAIKLILSLYDYINIKNVEFTPKFYFGVMENWDKIKQNNMAYFMFRFYLARNFAIIFNLAIAFICYMGFIPQIQLFYNLLR